MTRRKRFFLTGVAAAFALAWGMLFAWRYVAPFVFAAFFATIIDPAVGAVSRRLPIGRGGAVVVVLLFAFAAVGGLATVAVFNLSSEFERLAEAAPRYAAYARAAVDTVHRWADRLFSNLPGPLADAFRIGPEEWSGAAHAAARRVLAALGILPEALFGLLIGGMATYFVSKDRHRLWRSLLEAVPPEWQAAIVRFRDEIVGGVLGILRAQLVLVALTAALSVVGLALLRVPYAWALGLLAGLLDLAPLLGPSFVLLPTAGVYLLQGNSVVGLALLILWMIVVLVRQGVEPRLMGAGVGLHPVTVLAAVYVGVQAVGAAGFVAGPVFLVALKAVFVVTVSVGWEER